MRKLGGFEFLGTDPTITGRQATVELDVPAKIPMGWHRTPGGLFANVMGRVFTVEFDGPPADRDAPLTKGEFEGSLQRVSGTDVKVASLALAARWTDHARQARTYRTGRVFLAGDAAHVHSPFGGQGLNLGLVDAANLGWKLAAVLKGKPDDLLDTYTAERHPVGARVLANTRAQVALLRPDPHTNALRDIVSDLMKLPEGNRYIGEMLSGVDTRYDLGDDDPRVGTLVREPRLRDGKGLFVSPTDRLLPSGVHHARTDDGPSMLIRPDGCIAWIDGSSKPLDEALARWF